MENYRVFTIRDSDAVRDLVRNTFPGFLEGEYWDWKYLRNPRFDPSLVAVAEAKGSIIGCSHWLPSKLKLTPDIETNSYMTCDLAVKPGYQRQGIAKRLLVQRRSTEAFKKRGVVLTYDFANPKLAKRLYTPVLGYIGPRLSTKRYYKLLTWKKLIASTEKKEFGRALSERYPSFSNVDLTIRFKIRSAPLLTIYLSRGRVEAIEEIAAESDITVEGDMGTFVTLVETGNVKREIAWAILTRRIRIKGSLSKLFQAYRNMGVLEALFRIIFTRGGNLDLPDKAERYAVRGFKEGDEIGIIEVSNRFSENFGGFTEKTPEYWRWCCLERPDVSKDGLLVVTDRKNKSIVGYAVAGKSGSIWELCYAPGQDGEAIVSMLVSRALSYLDKVGVTSVSLNAPKSDETIRRVCKKYGFMQSTPPKMYLSILDLCKLISILAESKEDELKSQFDEVVSIGLKDAPSWIKGSATLRVDPDTIRVDSDDSAPTIRLETDFVTFTAIIFGTMNPSDAFLQSKLRISPPRKAKTLLEMLMRLQIKSNWTFPLSEYG